MDNSNVSAQAPITVLVEYEIRAENTTMDEWLQVWSHRGEDALFGEPDTSAYEALISLQEERQVLIFERYTNGDASVQAHIARPAHATLMEVMGERRMTRRRVMTNLFADVNGYGWWGRPEQVATMREGGIQLTILVTRFADDVSRQQYIELTGAHAKYCRTMEPGTLVYAGGIAMRDSDRGPDIKAGDLLFVAAFADEASAEKHRVDVEHVKLQKKLEEIERERVLVQSYKTTGSGFLWADK
jgi:quinol monooxygenase YgiN